MQDPRDTRSIQRPARQSSVEATNSELGLTVRRSAILWGVEPAGNSIYYHAERYNIAPEVRVTEGGNTWEAFQNTSTQGDRDGGDIV